MILYFVRHAQSLGNVGGEYDLTMSGKLSEHGQKQAEKLPDRLLKYEFDEIIVSPLERALRTIAPYLKKADRTAEIWPELVEARGNKHIPADVPPAMRFGGPVILPQDIKSLFRMRKDEAGSLMPPPDETYQEGQRRVTVAAERLRELHGGKDVSVLSVGHACSGARFLEAFLSISLDGRFSHRNTGLTCLKQLPNGTFVVPFSNRISEADETS
jgi:broad specificity phosphatase PhoE